MPTPNLSIRQALALSLQDAGHALSGELDQFLDEAATALNTMATEFLATGSGDPAYVTAQVRARAEQLLAMHLMRAEAQLKRDTINVVLAVLRGAIAVGAGV